MLCFLSSLANISLQLTRTGVLTKTTNPPIIGKYLSITKGLSFTTLSLLDIRPTGIPSEEAFGTPLIDQPGLGLTVNMSGWGIESGEHMAHFYDVQKDNLNRPVAGLVKGHREHEYRLNWGKESYLDKTYD